VRKKDHFWKKIIICEKKGLFLRKYTLFFGKKENRDFEPPKSKYLGLPDLNYLMLQFCIVGMS
jgi:hypothetical protein